MSVLVTLAADTSTMRLFAWLLTGCLGSVENRLKQLVCDVRSSFHNIKMMKQAHKDRIV